MPGRGRRFVARAVLSVASLSLLLGAGRSANGAEAIAGEPTRTAALVSAYRKAEGWPVKGLILLSLGERWHPVGAPIVLEALRSGDRRLQAYAVEALRTTAPEHLRRVLTPPLVEEVVYGGLALRNDRVRLNLLLLLARAFPEAHARSPQDWSTWWRSVKATYAVAPWPDAVSSRSEESTTVEAPAVRRALDLSQGGIQLVLAIDTTGSMQPTIEAVKAGMADAIRILSALAPDLELGLVQYRDREDLPNADEEEEGAVLVQRLTKRPEEVRDGLARLTAMGGGDLPERVEAALRVALRPTVGWTRKANKMVIVIGDAPPKSERTALELARWAKGSSGGPVGGASRPPSVTPRPPREPREPERLFTVSTVGVGAKSPLTVTAEAFRRIAAAGGGAYVPFATDGPPRAAGTEIVRRIVEISFGAEHAVAARRLVDVYLLYRDAGFIDDGGG